MSRNFLSDEPDRNLFHAIKRDKMFIKFHNNYDVMNEMAALSFELENFYGSNCSSRNFIVHSSLFLKLLAELFFCLLKLHSSGKCNHKLMKTFGEANKMKNESTELSPILGLIVRLELLGKAIK